MAQIGEHGPLLCEQALTSTAKSCVCWNNFKPSWDKIMNDPAAASERDANKPMVDTLNKACDGFATAPSFLLVAAAALSMTLFTLRNPSPLE
jgi:hypothetical protein